MKIEIINPTQYRGWNELLLSNPESNFFHTSAWASVLSETYRYRPLYFTIIEEGHLTALLPVMGIESKLTGRRCVSLPFSDECQPLAQDGAQFRALFELVTERATKYGWESIEIRGGQQYLNTEPCTCRHSKHTLSLSNDSEKIFKTFRSNVRRNIKKAQKEKLKCTISNTWESVRVFCRLNWLTRKIHGLPPQPIKFFKNIFKHVIAKDLGFVVLASRRGIPVAGAIYFYFNDSAIYKFGASDRHYLNIRPNNLVMWEAVKQLVQNGFKELDFGRTELQNTGLLQYKRAWGTNEASLPYYRYSLKNDRFIAAGVAPKTSYFLFKIMPLPISRLAGNILYRHVG